MIIPVWYVFKIWLKLHFCHANIFSMINALGNGSLKIPIISVQSVKKSLILIIKNNKKNNKIKKSKDVTIKKKFNRK